jgi:hypothetical protein
LSIGSTGHRAHREQRKPVVGFDWFHANLLFQMGKIGGCGGNCKIRGCKK